MFLNLPSQISSIDFLIEQIPDWKSLDSIFITASDYAKMKKDTRLNHDDSVWTREEFEADGKKHPALLYELQQVRFDLWIVAWIQYDGYRKDFTSSPLGNSIHISCKAA